MAGSEQKARMHATCVAVDGKAALLLGPPGSGKSDLALRLVYSSFQVEGRSVITQLVADDQVLLEARPGRLIARPPDTLAGLCEVRGLGILRLPHRLAADVVLAVELTAPEQIERLPEGDQHIDIAGYRLAILRVAPFQASAPLKVALALLHGPEAWNR